MQAPPAYREAAERWGYLADAEARHYGLPNGATLLLKIASGESSFNMGAVSPANARGATQFIPATRAAYIRQYHVDPWKNPEEAIHAAAIYMHTSGLAAYNPGGGQSYIDYILGQKISTAGGSPSPTHRGRGQSRESTSESGGGLGGELMQLGLTGVLVVGGVGLIGLGASRFLGASEAGKVLHE